MLDSLLVNIFVIITYLLIFLSAGKPPPARTLDPAEENIALKGEAAARASLARTPRNRRKPSELPKQETEYNVF